jgi:hypothetical protein
MTDQLRPFQASARVTAPNWPSRDPTATHLVERTQLTPDRMLLLPGLGLGARDQAVPFQDSARVPPVKSPTALQLAELLQDTPNRMLSLPGWGLGVIDQARPFQVSTRARSPGREPPA